MLFQSSSTKEPISIFRQFRVDWLFLNLRKQCIFWYPCILSQLTPQWTITHSPFRIVISKWSDNQNEVTIMCFLSLMCFPCQWHFLLLEIGSEPETVLLPDRNEAHRTSSVLIDFTSCHHQFEEKKLAKILGAHSECSNNSLEQ